MQSMTAFITKSEQGDWGSATWELRTVNHRYLEANFRLPTLLRDLESSLRQSLPAHLHRGKLDAALQFQPGSVNEVEITLNKRLLKSLLKSGEEIAQLTQEVSPLRIIDLLQWPGAIHITEADVKQAQTEILALFEQALADLVVCRQREGAALQAFLQSRLSAIANEVDSIRALQQDVADKWQSKLSTACQRAQVELDANRLAQEILLLVQKYDIAEELDRLQTHVAEVARVVEQVGPIGRRLDFLMQEINREANTIAAKSFDARVTAASVEIKVLLEQLREQIQNIE